MRDNVVIKIQRASNTTTTASGIVIPKQNNQTKEENGVVVAVGPGRILTDGKLIKPAVSEGDIVIFNKFAGTEVESNDNDIYLIVKENDILAIIKE
jgi:chaperonin GroES